MKSTERLFELGQSIWYDNIERKLLMNGELESMISAGEIYGVTSNPSIFNNAISKSSDYDEALRPMALAGEPPISIFYQLAVEDIQQAADLFLPVYQKTNGRDGYVSLEVNPYLANDTAATIDEVKTLWERVNRPNLMVKIPATKEGLPAVRTSIAEGINVNVTLIFSIERYREVIEAFISGLEDRLQAGKPLNHVHSVASFFISRMDTKVDKQLESLIEQNPVVAEKASALLGKAAIANAILADEIFVKEFNSERFTHLSEAGANKQRPLWASTSTKNPRYKAVHYVEGLIAPSTVNTVPPVTLTAMLEQLEVHTISEHDFSKAAETIQEIESIGIAVAPITDQLEVEGVKAFSDAFTTLLDTIKDRSDKVQKSLGKLQPGLSENFPFFRQQEIPVRIKAHDAALWTQYAAGQQEIKHRLGWLDAPYTGEDAIDELYDFVDGCLADGYTHALLLGMGGSSLAPEVLARSFVATNDKRQGLDLAVLDSTHPEQVKSALQRSPVEKTLYIVASKSGSTAEVQAFLDYFWHVAHDTLGDECGKHFIAITDPASPVQKYADLHGFRKVFLADPMVGGRFSALIAFGLVPAALIGVDLHRYLKIARQMAEQCQPEVAPARNPGLVLGYLMGQASMQGIDKLTILADPEIETIGSWLEQLIAESSGKEGKGIIPIDLEPQVPTTSYSNDRLFIYLHSSGALESFVDELTAKGYPAYTLEVPSAYHLGAQFFLWEYATAVACAILNVNAFDQPNVQDAKTRTTQKVIEYKTHGRLPMPAAAWQSDQTDVYCHDNALLVNAASLADCLLIFKSWVNEGDFIGINAFLPRNAENQAELQKLRATLLNQTGCPVTLGFGPRFLHSTGQLHKGGKNNGVFLQILGQIVDDVEIPGQDLSFGTMITAQALGDFEALTSQGRRVLFIVLKDALVSDLS